MPVILLMVVWWWWPINSCAILLMIYLMDIEDTIDDVVWYVDDCSYVVDIRLRWLLLYWRLVGQLFDVMMMVITFNVLIVHSCSGKDGWWPDMVKEIKDVVVLPVPVAWWPIEFCLIVYYSCRYCCYYVK